MTTRNEEIYTMIKIRDFLRKLLIPSESPKVPRHIRKEAYWCLRHFPLRDKDIPAILEETRELYGINKPKKKGK